MLFGDDDPNRNYIAEARVCGHVAMWRDLGQW